MRERRLLTAEERAALEQRGCIADNWDDVQVAPEFEVTQLRNVRFEGQVSIGAKSRITDAVICNYAIGDNCLIESVTRMECRHSTRFGEGVRVSAVNENGGREVVIYRNLTAQCAYLMAMMRHNKAATNALAVLAEDAAERRRSEQGIVADNVRIIGVKFLREVLVEQDATIEGASLLENGTVGRRATVGVDVRAEDFIFAEDSKVKGGAIVERCYVGANTILSNGFTAVDSLFFANCHCENGEAAAIFAGPYTVSHHKSSLLIAGVFSFFNAGSGTNQSNHLFKSGAVHQAIHMRGTKFGSNAYVMAPAIEGPYTVILGRHTRHHDLQDMPYAYLIEENGQSSLLPAMALTSYGAVRDTEKWKTRDKRTEKRDNIRFEEFNPFLTGKMLRGVDALTRMRENDPEAKTYTYNRTVIKASMLARGIKLYNSAIAASLGAMLSAGRHTSTAPCDGEWIDLAGQYLPLAIVEQILDQAANNSLTLDDLHETLDKAMAEYEDMAATYAYATLGRLMGHQPSEEEVRETITAGENILARMRETTDNDRRRDAGEDMWIGYGYDFREVDVREQDFKNTR